MVNLTKKKRKYVTRKEKRDFQGYSLIDLTNVLNKDFKDLSKLLDGMKDPRNLSYTKYSQSLLIMELILMHLIKCESMNEMTRKFNNENITQNICKLVNTEQNELAHGDTINNYLKELDPNELENVKTIQVRKLIESKKFDKYKIDGKFVIAVDGTQIYSTCERHCKNCLKQITKEGNERYYHVVLEAKLILGNMVISIGSEFVENEDENVSKQDCEINAFKRLEKKIKKKFPKLKFIIIADALYANEKIFDICENNNWDAIIRFKEGTGKNKYLDFVSSKIKCGDLHYSNKIYYKKDENKKLEKKDKNKTLSIVGSNELYIDEENNNKTEKWMFITNLKITEENIEKIYNIGRSRWKIENEGFNVQKNKGYGLEHMYSRNNKAMKNHYLIIQIAHMIEQMILKHRAKYKKIGEIIKNLWENTREFSEDLANAISNSITFVSIHLEKCIVKKKNEKIFEKILS